MIAKQRGASKVAAINRNAAGTDLIAAIMILKTLIVEEATAAGPAR